MVAILSQPMVRLLIPFISGIILFIRYPILNSTNFALFSFFTIIFAYPICRKNSKYNWIIGCAIFSVFTSIGYSFCQRSITLKASNHFSKLNNFPLAAKIISEPRNRNNYIVAEAEIIYGILNKKFINIKGKCLLYLPASSKKPSLGSTVLISNQNSEPVGFPANPDQFNAKKYYYYKDIHHKIYLKDPPLVISIEKKNIWNFSIYIRDKLIDSFKKFNFKGDELGVISALVLGFDDEISDELMTAYASTGTLHALSVSGMHVGIIFIMISSILGNFKNKARGKYIYLLGILSFLWIYAFITGLSPSVLRATAMFSFMTIANGYQKKTNIFNTLAASAFLILLFNPFYLVNPGFQLSYLAVIGIVIIYPIIKGKMKTEKWILVQFRDIVAISIAAQLSTAPISIFYFGQFPTYFLLSNILVVPLSGIILYGGIVHFMAAIFNFSGNITSGILNFLIKFLNSGIFYLEKLPHSVIEHLQIDLLTTSMLYLLLFALTGFIISANKKYFIFSLVIINLICFWNLFTNYSHQIRKEIIFINQPGKVWYYNNGGKKYFTWHQPSNEKISNESKIPMQFIPHKKEKFKLVIYGKLRIGFLAEPFRHYNIEDKLNCLVLGRRASGNLEDIIQKINPELIIADAGISLKTSRIMRLQCKKNGILFYSIRESGSLFLDISNSGYLKDFKSLVNAERT